MSKIDCLNRDLEHDYHFVKAENGKQIWTCCLCGFSIIEWDDSQP